MIAAETQIQNFSRRGFLKSAFAAGTFVLAHASPQSRSSEKKPPPPQPYSIPTCS